MSDTPVEFNLDGSFRRVTLTEELRIESKLTPHRRGQLYGLAADEVERLTADLSTARAQLDERKLLNEAAIEATLGVMNRQREEIARLRADAERRLLVILELVAIEDSSTLTQPIRPYLDRSRAAWDAARREGKDHQT